MARPFLLQDGNELSFFTQQAAWTVVGAAGAVLNSASQLACLGTSRDSQTSHLPPLTDLPLDHHIAQLVSGPSRQGPTAGLPHGQALDPTSCSRFLQAACREAELRFPCSARACGAAVGL